MILQGIARIGIIVCLFSVQACAAAPIPPGTPTYQALYDEKTGAFTTGQPKPFALREEDRRALQAALEKDFNDMMALCQKALGNYESEAKTFKLLSFTIAVVGALAGTVAAPALLAAAPAANKAAATAFSGVSGAANTAQSALIEKGLTAPQALETREGIAKEIRAATEEYSNAFKELDLLKRFDLMAAAIVKGKAACIAYDIAKTSGASKQK